MAVSAWAKRRQIIYGGGVVFIVLSVLVPVIFFTTYEAPTCFDGKRNQGESDIDRGGPCKLLDARFVQSEAVKWARPFEVRDGYYNAVAYVENPNKDAGAQEVTYQFKLYDKDNILISERFGKTPLFPGKVFPIFESRIDVGKRVPVRATFAFVTDIVWERMEDATRGLVVFNERMSDLDTAPRVDAEVKNTTLQAYRNVVLVATIFDASGNAINSSRTLVSAIKPGEALPIAFTWPIHFNKVAAKLDIVPLVLPVR